MNPAKCLTALKSPVKVHKVLVYDLESKKGPTQEAGFTRVFLGGVFDGKRYQAFRNDVRSFERPWESRAIGDGGAIDQLLRYVLTRSYRGFYIYAHNGGSFDHLHLVPWLTAHVNEFAYSIIPIQSAIQILKVTHRKSQHSWTFLDSVRLLPMGLDQAAKTFGFQGKLSHDLGLHEDDPRWEDYLRRDCEALYESVTQYQHLIVKRLGGEMGVTSPSTAMRLYRRKFMGHGKSPAMIPQHRHFKGCRKPDCEGCLHEWIRLGYYGGRTEVFRIGGKGLSYYDINSSYPRAMLEGMPGGRVRFFSSRSQKQSVKSMARLARDHVGFVECEVEIPRSCYLPPLPHRDERTGKLIFPVGRFRGVWPWEELALLSHRLVRGRIRKVFRSVWFERKTLFFDFVKELYAFRDKKSASYEEGLAMVSKLMMNSLYGKFGMNEERREIVLLGPDDAAPEGSTFPTTEDGEPDILSRVCYVDKRVSPPYVIPQISAQITALARVRLWHFMADVLQRGGKLYYCDTDSLITDVQDLRCSSELGELKNEYPGEVLDVEIAGPKMYLLKKRKLDARGKPGAYTAFEKTHGKHCVGEGCPGCKKSKLAMKGVPKDVRTVRTLRTFQRGRKVHFDRLEKLGGMAQKGLREAPTMVRVFKRLHEGNHKRVFLKNGNSKPHELREGDE